MGAEGVKVEKNDSSEKRGRHQAEAVPEAGLGSLTARQTDMLHMQRTLGNAAVQRKLASAAANRIQRDPPAGDPFILDSMTVNTKGDLIQFYTVHQALMLTESNDLTKDGLSFPTTMMLGPIAAERNKAALAGKDSEPVGADDHAKAETWFTSFESAMQDAEKTKASAASAKLLDAATKFQATAVKITNDVIPDLKDLERKTFAKGSSNQVLDVADAISTALDTSLVLKDGVINLRSTSTGLLADELKWLGKGAAPTLTWVPKVLEIATKIDKAYAAFQLVRAALTVAGGAATSAEEGRNAISAMSTVISAGGTLLNASAGMTVYANLYIGPMVDKCLELMAKIEDMLKNQNLELMKNGLWDAVAWDVEQGGKPMFDFMKQVMHAGSGDQIPSPIPDAVTKLMMNKEQALDAGVKKGNPMPTTGSWFWKKPDPDKINSWVFRSRNEIWAMLYGSAPVP